MGLFAWLQDCWIMMMRTKPQYISVLGRKRSSIRSPHKLDNNDDNTCKARIKSCVCLLVMCCSISYGVLLLLLNDDPSLSPSNMLVPLIVAGVASISGGLCLSEYISTKPQEVPSIYSCCYQYSSEVLAFFVGWSWLLSQGALVAAFCRLSAELLQPWTHEFLQHYFHHAESLLAVLFVLAVLLLANTGFSEGIVWFVCFVPFVFVLVVSSVVTNGLSNKEGSYDGGWFEVKSVDQILHLASLSTLFFSGPHSILRLTHTQVHSRSHLALGPLNLLSLILLTTTLLSSPSFLIPSSSSSSTLKFLALLPCVPSSLEALRHLFFVVEDMACDGLLFRGLAKKANPCGTSGCSGVPGYKVQGLVGIGVGVAAGMVGVKGLVVMAVVFPLGVNCVVPYLVLLQRYRDTTSWQYEPMFQTTARTLRDRSRRRSEEHQYTNGHHPGFDHPFEPTTTCIDEEGGDPSSSSSEEEDIDSVVQQYRDQAKIANMATLDEHDPNDQVPEPTPVSAGRARVIIGVHFTLAAVNAGVMNCWVEPIRQMVLVAAGLGSLLLATVVQAVLLCFPQNKGQDKGCCSRVPRMPWVPGMAAFINKCLFVNAVMGIWPVYVGWIGLGLLVYFCYGIRSSTAANSFYNLSPAHIALCPLPSYGNKCVTQVVPSQRKKGKTKLLRKSSNSSRRKPIMA